MTVGLSLNELSCSIIDPYKMNGFGIFKIPRLSPEHNLDQMTVYSHADTFA